MKGLLKKRGRCTSLLGVVPFGLSVLAGCGSGAHSTVSTPVAVSGAITPTVTVTASPAGGISLAQTLSVSVAVTSGSATPQGSVVLSSGNYASFPTSISAGQAVIHVPAGLLAVGTDTLTASFTPSDASSYNSASGTADVSVTDASAATQIVAASSVTYSTGGFGSPFRALPLASGNVLVSVTAATSGMLVFVPAAGGGLKLSCFNYVRPSFVQDGASDLGMNLTPNGAGIAATLGVDGAIFYDLSTLQTCTSTGLQVSQGTDASHQGSFDVVVTPDGKYAFVANEFGVAAGATTEGNIGVVALQYDPTGMVTTGTLLGQISTGGQGIAGVTISPDGSRLYVTSEVAGASSKAAGASNPVLRKTNCTEQAGVAAHANGLLTVIDVAVAEASHSPSAIVATVNAGCTPVRAVETTNGSTLWVSARGDNRVLAFSTGMLEANPDDALLGYADTGGTEPVGLRLFDSEKLMAVANSNRFETGTANATILSIAVPAKASVVQTIPTGLFPREITVGSDDRTLYLTNYNSGSLQVITTSVQ